MKKKLNRSVFRTLIFRYPFAIFLNAFIVLGSIFVITYYNKIDVRIIETGVLYQSGFNQYIRCDLDKEYEKYLRINDEIKWWYESNKEVNNATIKEINVKENEIIVIAQSDSAVESNTKNIFCEVVIQQRLLYRIIDSVFSFDSQ